MNKIKKNRRKLIVVPWSTIACAFARDCCLAFLFVCLFSKKKDGPIEILSAALRLTQELNLPEPDLGREQVLLKLFRHKFDGLVIFFHGLSKEGGVPGVSNPIEKHGKHTRTKKEAFFFFFYLCNLASLLVRGMCLWFHQKDAFWRQRPVHLFEKLFQPVVAMLEVDPFRY